MGVVLRKTWQLKHLTHYLESPSLLTKPTSSLYFYLNGDIDSVIFNSMHQVKKVNGRSRERTRSDKHATRCTKTERCTKKMQQRWDDKQEKGNAVRIFGRAQNNGLTAELLTLRNFFEAVQFQRWSLANFDF